MADDEEPRKKFSVRFRYECNICGWRPDQYDPLPRDFICPECRGNVQRMPKYKLEEE